MISFSSPMKKKKKRKKEKEEERKQEKEKKRKKKKKKKEEEEEEEEKCITLLCAIGPTFMPWRKQTLQGHVTAKITQKVNNESPLIRYDKTMGGVSAEMISFLPLLLL